MKKQEVIEAYLDIKGNRIKISNKGDDIYLKTSIFIDDNKGWIIESDFIPKNLINNFSRWHRPFKVFGNSGTKVRVVLEKDKEEFIFPHWTEYEKSPINENWDKEKEVIFDKTWII